MPVVQMLRSSKGSLLNVRVVLGETMIEIDAAGEAVRPCRGLHKAGHE